MVISRRDVLTMGTLGGAALFIPSMPAFGRSSGRNRLAQSQIPAPFTVPLPVPPVLAPVRSNATTDFYDITMLSAQAGILPGLSTTIFGYNGITPGPTIRAKKGRRVVVRQNNLLPQRHPTLGYECTTSVHLHGNSQLPQFDGWAEDLSHPGFFKDYEYPNDQDHRTLWYHDHALEHTAENTYMGLAGLYLIDNGENLPLPKGDYDIPLVIQDKLFTADGQLLFDDNGQKDLMGDVLLVNGKPQPFLRVERRKYLFRILNASTSRAYRLALSTGDPFTFVGTDSGLMPVPQQDTTFRMSVAERYEVVIDFAKYPIGQQVVLRNLELKNNEDFPTTRQVMRFDVVSEPSDLSNNEVPAVLMRNPNPYNPMLLIPSQARRIRDWRFERRNGMWAINGLFWDPNRPDANPGLGDVEIWEFINKSGGWFHPIHAHLIDFQILDRNGRPPFPYELGPKDTVYLGENETVRVIARFGPFEGKYMMHCHNIVHEDHDMMVNYEVGRGGPDPVTTAPPRPLPAPPL
jgi:FtsP/CotA-like multicopper oxidase with cupredoxin domain